MRAERRHPPFGRVPRFEPQNRCREAHIREGAPAHERLSAHDPNPQRLHPQLRAYPGRRPTHPVRGSLQVLDARGDHAEHGHLLHRAGRIPVQRQRGLEPGQRHLVAAERTAQRVRPGPGHDLPLPRQYPGLGSTQQLVPRKRHQIHPRRHAPGRRGLVRQPQIRAVDQQPRPQVVDHRHAACGSEPDQLRQGGFFGEARHREVGAVDLQDRRHAPGRHGARIVLQPRAVRGPHGHEARAGCLDHLGNAESAADLHEFPVRYRNTAARRARGQRDRDRGGAVVDDQRVFGAGQLGHQAGAVIVPRPPLAGPEVELDVAVAGCILHGFARLAGQRRAPQVGVQDHPGAVDDAAQRRGLGTRDLHLQRFLVVVQGAGCGDGARAHVGQQGAHARGDPHPAARSDQQAAPRLGQDPVDARDRAARVVRVGHGQLSGGAGGATVGARAAPRCLP